MASRSTTDPLQQIPGIGPSLASDLRLLGYQGVAELADADPEEMYARLDDLTGTHQDPCVLYTFRCAVYYARTPIPEPELCKWWNWKGRSLPTQG